MVPCVLCQISCGSDESRCPQLFLAASNHTRVHGIHTHFRFIYIYSYLLQTAFHIIQNGSRTQSKTCIISVIEGKGLLFRFAWGKFRYTYYIHPYMFWRIRSKGYSFLCTSISKMMYIKNDVDVDVFILWKPPTCNYFPHVKRKMM